MAQRESELIGARFKMSALGSADKAAVHLETHANSGRLLGPQDSFRPLAGTRQPPNPQPHGRRSWSHGGYFSASVALYPWNLLHPGFFISILPRLGGFPMRIFGVSAAAAFAVLASAAVAQTSGPNTASPPQASSPPIGAVTPTAGNPPEVGGPLLPATDAGLDKVASDGISTRTVPAVPCSKAARETDGTTTCVGIPGPIRSVRGGDFREGVTTGMSRP
jgi:hypothetical protein